MMKNKPCYQRKYQYELAEELTGRNKRTITAMMRRKNWSLVQAICHYLGVNQGKM